MNLFNSLKNDKLWDKVDVSQLTATFFEGLSNPYILNDKSTKLFQTKFIEDPLTGKWISIIKASKNIEKSIAVLFEHKEGNQVAILYGKPIQKPSYNENETEISNLFKSRYIRRYKRYNTEYRGWYLSDIKIPEDQLNVEKKKTTL